MSRVRFKQPWFRKKLYVSNKPYFIEKDRESGEKDLENLVDTESYEGCWLFDVEGSRWFNIKINDESTHCATTMIPSFSGFGELSHYHTHQKNFVYQERGLLLAGFQEPDQLVKNIITNYTAIHIAHPSKGDITSYSEIVQLAPDHPIDFRIASPYGVMIVKFDRTADITKATAKYKEVHDNDEKLTEIAASVINPKQAIAQAVHLINQHMQGVFTTSMRYRLGDIKC